MYNKLKKAKDIGEIAYLKMKGIPIKKIDKYERKSVCWFEDNNNESTEALNEYYQCELSKYYSYIKESKDFLLHIRNEIKEKENQEIRFNKELKNIDININK